MKIGKEKERHETLPAPEPLPQWWPEEPDKSSTEEPIPIELPAPAEETVIYQR